jgi:hypothetical protein
MQGKNHMHLLIFSYLLNISHSCAGMKKCPKKGRTSGHLMATWPWTKPFLVAPIFDNSEQRNAIDLYFLLLLGVDPAPINF